MLPVKINPFSSTKIFQMHKNYISNKPKTNIINVLNESEELTNGNYNYNPNKNITTQSKPENIKTKIFHFDRKINKKKLKEFNLNRSIPRSKLEMKLHNISNYSDKASNSCRFNINLISLINQNNFINDEKQIMENSQIQPQNQLQIELHQQNSFGKDLEGESISPINIRNKRFSFNQYFIQPNKSTKEVKENFIQTTRSQNVSTGGNIMTDKTKLKFYTKKMQSTKNYRYGIKKPLVINNYKEIDGAKEMLTYERKNSIIKKNIKKFIITLEENTKSTKYFSKIEI
jgi:hypothetical protein